MAGGLEDVKPVGRGGKKGNETKIFSPSCFSSLPVTKTHSEAAILENVHFFNLFIILKNFGIWILNVFVGFVFFKDS